MKNFSDIPMGDVCQCYGAIQAGCGWGKYFSKPSIILGTLVCVSIFKSRPAIGTLESIVTEVVSGPLLLAH